MTDEDIKNIYESYLKGQIDTLVALIEITKRSKEIEGDGYVSLYELLIFYNKWLKKVKKQYERG